MAEKLSYHQLLKRLLVVERMGEELYGVLSLKTKDGVRKEVYRSLAANEKQAGRTIEKELAALCVGADIPKRGMGVRVAVCFLHVLPLALLERLLRRILSKKMYSRLFVRYRHKNQAFWGLLLQHENLQHECLTPFWTQS